MLDLIQVNFTPGKIKKILQGEEPAPQFYNKAFGRYDAVVEDGLNTATQRQMQFAQLMYLREAGVPIPTSQLLEASTLQNKDKLINAIEQQEQQQAQMMQQQAQAQQQVQMAQVELSKARAQADQGLGIERLSRVQENQALAQERKAQAIKDEEIGLLNLVKALKEIDTVDLNHIEKLVSLSNLLKAQQQAENELQTPQQPQEGPAVSS